MNKKVNDFPYPVLRNDNHSLSSYKKDINFLLQVNEPTEENGNYKFTVQVDTNSYVINTMLDDGIVNIYITYETKNIKKTIKLENSKEVKDIFVPFSILESTDSIFFEAVVISNENLDLPYDEEMEEAYNLEIPFYITKKDKIAISNKVVYNFDKSGRSIVKIVKDPELNEGFYVNLSQDEYIIISFSPNLQKSYQDLNIKKTSFNIPIMTILNSNLIYMAIISTLYDLVLNGYDQHINKRWYKALISNLSNKGIDLESKLDEWKNGIDTKDVYMIVNTLLNCFYDKTLKKCLEV